MNEDLIKRENATEVIYNALRTPPLKGVFTDTMSLAVAMAQDIPSADRPQEEWIPCSERMPSEKEWAESYIRDKRASEFIVMIKGASRPTTLYLSRDHYWFDENHNFYEVCAWQSLPKPWKGADK